MEEIFDRYWGTLKKFSVFKGRASRREYFTFIIINLGIQVFLTLFVRYAEIDFIPGFHLIDNIFEWVMYIPTITVGIRRLHDSGHSGWFLLVPIYNIYLMFVAGDSGINEFGDEPED